MKKTFGNKFSRPAYLEIDLDALAFNIRNIKKKLGDAVELLAVVKADGYGHGACEASKVALENGAGSLGVAILEEGIELREKGISAPIVILCPEFPGREKKIVEYDLEPIVTDLSFPGLLSQEAVSQAKVVDIYLKVDTGMGRYGIQPEKAEEFVKQIERLKNLKLKGVISQFSTAEEDKDFAYKQLKIFKQVVEKLKPLNDDLVKSIANSGAVLDIPESYFNQVRVGILMYGWFPSSHTSESVAVKPILSLKSRIVFLKEVEPGTPIGYGRAFVTQRKTKVATVPLGYADGISRLLSNKGEVLVKGKRAVIIGRVCMDVFMIDVTDIPQVEFGDEVVLIGKQGEEEISVHQVGEWSQTFAYEIMSRMGRRLPLLYVKSQ